MYGASIIKGRELLHEFFKGRGDNSDNKSVICCLCVMLQAVIVKVLTAWCDVSLLYLLSFL